MGLVGEIHHRRNVVAVQVREDALEFRDGREVAGVARQIERVAAMAGTFADLDFRRSQAVEHFDGRGDHRAYIKPGDSRELAHAPPS